MIMSVSTLVMSSGAATPVREVNFSIFCGVPGLLGSRKCGSFRLVSTFCQTELPPLPRDSNQSMEFAMITDRSEVTNMIRAAKIQKNISSADVATESGQRKEWTTAGCLGQMAFNKSQPGKIGPILGLLD